jgi:hypothetical protein
LAVEWSVAGAVPRVAAVIIHRTLFSTLRGFGESPKAAISENRLDIIMPHFHDFLLEAWVRDAELIPVGKAMLVTLIGDGGDRYLFAGLFLD